MRLKDGWQNSTVITKLLALRKTLQRFPLPSFLKPIGTIRHLLLSFLLLCGTALVISITVDLLRGVGSVEAPSALFTHMWVFVLSGVLEEVLFRGLAKRILGNGGLVIGTICWVVLHQFYAGITTIYRLPSDILIGMFYIKLWRGSWWWLSLIIHPLWNVAIIGGWQLAKIYLF